MAPRSESRHTVLDIQVDVNLLQCHPHAWTLDIGKHDKLDVRRSFVVMELILTCVVADETNGKARQVISIGVHSRRRWWNVLPIIVTPEFASHVP